PKLMTGPMTGAFGADDVVASGAMIRKLRFQMIADSRSLMLGEHWLRAIDAAIEFSRFFIAGLSSRSVDKRSRFQAELRYALDCAALLPPGDTFFIPVRFDDCRVPLTIARTIPYVHLFPDRNRGLRRVLKTACEQLLRDLTPETEKRATSAEPE
ncbi:MAG: TIR domain-containing protein, partial [Acidobacteria bacterium]|nr:TIR domain-containing protein [Acidobacteriota bacterium]